MKRRDLLKYSATTVAGLGLIPGLAPFLQGCGVKEVQGYIPVYMNPADFENLRAIAETILPETDTPGATTAGVAPFADLLIGELFEEEEKSRLIEAIAHVNAISERTAGVPFASAEISQQQTSLENAGKEHFERIRQLVLWGYFTSEPGMKAMNYQPVPGHYDGCTPADSSTKIIVGNR